MKKKVFLPAPCSLGLSEGGDWPNFLLGRLLKCRFLAPQSLRWYIWALLIQVCTPTMAVTASETIKTARAQLNTAQSLPKLFPQVLVKNSITHPWLLPFLVLDSFQMSALWDWRSVGSPGHGSHTSSSSSYSRFPFKMLVCNRHYWNQKKNYIKRL